ncbi:hypothetical protein OkiPb01309_02380 [Bordetella pertussis]
MARPGQERRLVPRMRRLFRNLTSRLRLGLFGRTFLLLAALMLVSLGAWLQVFFSMELGPRANQMAQRVITAVNITRTALVYSHTDERSKLLLDLATNEGIQVYPRELTDFTEALPDDDYWQRVAQHIRVRFGPETQIAWGVNQVPGFWVSFQIDQDLYWLVFEREQIGLTGGIEWLGWGATALLLSLVGAAVSVGFVNRPLSRLARAAQVLSRGETPAPLPEQGPLEIRDLNALVQPHGQGPAADRGRSRAHAGRHFTRPVHAAGAHAPGNRDERRLGGRPPGHRRGPRPDRPQHRAADGIRAPGRNPAPARHRHFVGAGRAV